MKNTKKLFGIITISVIIGFLFAGCTEPGDKYNNSEDPGKEMLPQGDLPAPKGVKAETLSANSIQVSWEPVQGAIMYNIYLYFSSKASNNDYKDKSISLLSSTTSTFKGLSGGATYYFRVTALDSSGEGRFSSIVSATTLPGPLGRPTGLTATPQSKTEIQLSWDPVLGADGYYIEQSTSSTFPSSPTQYTTPSESYKVTGLSVGALYYFRVRAYVKDDASRLSEYSSTNVETWYEVPQTATSLTEGIWTDGSISVSGEAWYSFNVKSDTTYYVWWDDKDNSTKTLDAKSSAYYGNGSGIFNNIDAGYNAYRSFKASSTAVVFVKVFSTPTGAGTFGITYSTTNTRPKAGFIPEDAKPLTAGKWTDGEITESTGEAWYKFTATAAINYLWWNDKGLGNGLKSLDVNVSVFKSNETPIFTNVDYAWSSGRSAQSLTVGDEYYICVTPRTSGGTGTFAIAFNNNSNTRPLIVPASPKTLNAGTWAEDEISIQGGENYYSLTAAAGTQYYLWWNENGTTSGNGLKTLNVDVSVFSSDGDILLPNNTGNGWTASQTITPTASGVIYIRLKANSAYYTGTYGIVYDTNNKRPAVPAPASTSIIKGTWANGNIAAGGEQWFKFKATSATHFIHVSFGTISSALYAQLYDNNLDPFGTAGFLYSDQKNFSCQLTVGNDYYIRVTAQSSIESGTFKMTFNDSFGSPDVIRLTAGVWANGNVPARDEECFEFTATAGTQYIHVSFGTLSNMNVQLYASNGVAVGKTENLYSSINSMDRTVSVGQVYYIRVKPYSSSGSGSYKIAFNTSSTAPAQ